MIRVRPNAAGPAAGAATQLVWYGRNTRLNAAGPEAEYSLPELSPDGKFVAYGRGSPRDIWVLDIEKGLNSPLTSDPADDFAPRWSLDGKTIAFSSMRDGGTNLYSRAVGVVADDKLLFKSDGAKTLSDWSRDGKYLVYTADNDIWALSLNGSSGALASPSRYR